MAEPRKVFRIEQTAGLRPNRLAEADRAGVRHAEIMGVLNALHAAALPGRIERELCAAVDDSERATQRILAAAEQIEAAANDLSAGLHGRPEQGLAQDIQDLVTAIFEACNFQDLMGQRLAKVTATSRFVEGRIARMLGEVTDAGVIMPHGALQALHGPRPDRDRGHLNQDEIDAVFLSRS